MNYFTPEDFASLDGASAAELLNAAAFLPLRQRFLELHLRLSTQFRTHNLPLQIYDSHPLRAQSVAAGLGYTPVLAVDYLRPEDKSRAVERVMGRDDFANQRIEAERHPAIELRLTRETFALELVVPPSARIDQENLVGKLRVERQRLQFFEALGRLDRGFCLGYWRGLHLSEMHLTGHYFRQPSILKEWLDTFDAGRDWLRLGLWYSPQAAELDAEFLVPTLTLRIKALYRVYEEIAWTSANDYREFFRTA